MEEGQKKKDGGKDGKKAADTTTVDQAAQRSRLFYRNSDQFRLLERLFDASQPGHLQLETRAQQIAIQRLVKSDLVRAIAGRKVNGCCGRAHASYSITLAGRAHFVATKLGLTFPQLCYLACGRGSAQNAVTGVAPGFADGDVDPVFFMVLRGAQPSDIRKALARKGFIARREWHFSSITPRFVEVERHGTVLDELCLWMRSEYEARIIHAIQDPAIARVVSLLP